MKSNVNKKNFWGKVCKALIRLNLDFYEDYKTTQWDIWAMIYGHNETEKQQNCKIWIPFLFWAIHTYIFVITTHEY